MRVAEHYCCFSLCLCLWYLCLDLIHISVRVRLKFSLLSWSQSVDSSLDSRETETKTLNHPISSHLVRARAHSLASFGFVWREGWGEKDWVFFCYSIPPSFLAINILFLRTVGPIFTLGKKAYNKTNGLTTNHVPCKGAKWEKKHLASVKVNKQLLSRQPCPK